jgi:hypothetical protein
LQIQAQNNAGPLTGRYTSSDTLSGIIWPAGASPDSALSIAPTGLWIDPTAGTWSYNLTAAQTLAIPAGQYKTSVQVAHAGNIEDVLEADLDIEGTGLVLAPPAGSSVLGPDTAALGLITPLYCTDEDIQITCESDYISLLPRSQIMARGADGKFLMADPWTLISASSDFTAQLPGLWSQQGAGPFSQTGYVVSLTRPQSAFPAGGMLMGVALGSGPNLSLRRLGMPSGWGVAPAPAAGLVGVEFSVATFYPQIEAATYELNQRYNIGINAIRPAASINDMRVLQSTCITMVLIDRYSDESRARTGDYSYKIDMLKNKLSALEAKLTLRWTTGLDQTQQTNWFSTRIVR